jgi:hypothetical protein
MGLFPFSERIFFGIEMGQELCRQQAQSARQDQ